MKVKIPAKVIAEVSIKNDVGKYACIANERVVCVVTNTPEGIAGMQEAFLTGAEVGIDVWVDDTSSFTYNYKRKENR